MIKTLKLPDATVRARQAARAERSKKTTKQVVHEIRAQRGSTERHALSNALRKP